VRDALVPIGRATDTKLNREVAIKVLPTEVAQDPERLARFQREAQLLAALNHPNVAAIHGLEEAEGTPFLALELVEGEDLSERLKRGKVPIDEALDIAMQIAEALEAAHEKGIVHRDTPARRTGRCACRPASLAATVTKGRRRGCEGVHSRCDPSRSAGALAGRRPGRGATIARTEQTEMFGLGIQATFLSRCSG